MNINKEISPAMVAQLRKRSHGHVVPLDIPTAGNFIMHGNTKHGLWGSKLLQSWYDMIYRCYNPNHKSYSNYGARGIKVCDEWKNDPSNYITYVKQLSNAEKEGFSLDRIDNNSNYQPGNIRWATRQTQSINRRLMKNNKSGYNGIYKRKDSGKWQSTIRINGRLHMLGCYNNIQDAVKARNSFIVENNYKQFPIQ